MAVVIATQKGAVRALEVDEQLVKAAWQLCDIIARQLTFPLSEDVFVTCSDARFCVMFRGAQTGGRPSARSSWAGTWAWQGPYCAITQRGSIIGSGI